MIYSLRRKFILVSAISTVLVFACIFTGMFFLGKIQLNNTMDELTDTIAGNKGFFPEFNREEHPISAGAFPYADVITEESQFSTRFFTVWLNSENEIDHVNMDSIRSISEQGTQAYIDKALKSGKERGWVSDYRYKIFETDNGKGIVFVNGTTNRIMVYRSLYTSLIVLGISSVIILILFILISKKVVRPIAESYEKQKQFVTDANHELKTPLTLILSNLDIVEEEMGKNDWLDDIRIESERMRSLVNQLVTLSRMDEDGTCFVMVRFDLSKAAEETISEFEVLAEERGKKLVSTVEPGLSYQGDEGAIRHVISILLDNAIKYCDQDGSIQIKVYGRRIPVITVKNTFHDVNKVEMDRLFDRFYREDKARSFQGSFGIGLSIAKAIIKGHHSDIYAYKKDATHICFKVILK